jgi:hypothetical protein
MTWRIWIIALLLPGCGGSGEPDVLAAHRNAAIWYPSRFDVHWRDGSQRLHRALAALGVTPAP